MASVAAPHSTQPEQQREQEQRQQQESRVVRARLVQRLVANGGNLPEFMHDLITTQAVVVAGTEAAGFLVEGSGPDGKAELRTVAHVRPDGSEENVRRQALLAFREIVTQCIAEDKDGAMRVSPPGENVDPQFCLVTLLRSDDRVVAASAVVTRCKDESRALQRLSTMQLVAGYFDLFLIKRQNEQSRQIARTHQDVFQYASTVATAENFHASASNLCNELATRNGAARVAIGWVHGENVKLKAISHTEEFDKKQGLSVQLVKVMEECLDQDEFTQFDPAGASTDNVTREAMTLSQMEGGNRVASLPLRLKDRIVGILTLEFPPEKPGSPAESTALAAASELLAPQLYDRYQNDRYLITKAGLSVRDNSRKIFGLRTHTLAKVVTLAVLGLVAFVVFYSPMHRVSAPFQFVSETQRVVSAPFEATLAEATVEAGDVVEAGQVLAVLDTRDLEQERLAALSGAQTAAAEAEALLADRTRDPSAIARYNAKLAEQERYQVQADMLGLRIDRATVRAPMSGTVLQAPGRTDLRERVGSVVQLGDPLVLIGDPSTLKLEIQMPDRDIERIRPGQRGELATAARPDVKVPVSVDRIVESAAAQGGTNSFTVYASADNRDPNWRPGATGEVRLDDRPRPLIVQWTHRLVEYVRIRLWL